MYVLRIAYDVYRRSTTMVSAASCISISTQRICQMIFTSTFSCRSSSARQPRQPSPTTCWWLAAGRTVTCSGRGRRRTLRHTSRHRGFTALLKNYTDWPRNCTTLAAPLSYLVDAVEQVCLIIQQTRGRPRFWGVEFFCEQRSNLRAGQLAPYVTVRIVKWLRLKWCLLVFWVGRGKSKFGAGVPQWLCVCYSAVVQVNDRRICVAGLHWTPKPSICRGLLDWIFKLSVFTGASASSDCVRVNKKLSYRRETARQLRIRAQLTRCFSVVAV